MAAVPMAFMVLMMTLTMMCVMTLMQMVTVIITQVAIPVGRTMLLVFPAFGSRGREITTPKATATRAAVRGSPAAACQRPVHRLLATSATALQSGWRSDVLSRGSRSQPRRRERAQLDRAGERLALARLLSSLKAEVMPSACSCSAAEPAVSSRFLRPVHCANVMAPSFPVAETEMSTTPATASMAATRQPSMNACNAQLRDSPATPATALGPPQDRRGKRLEAPAPAGQSLPRAAGRRLPNPASPHRGAACCVPL